MAPGSGTTAATPTPSNQVRVVGADAEGRIVDEHRQRPVGREDHPSEVSLVEVDPEPVRTIDPSNSAALACSAKSLAERAQVVVGQPEGDLPLLARVGPEVAEHVVLAGGEVGDGRLQGGAFSSPLSPAVNTSLPLPNPSRRCHRSSVAPP